MYGICSKWMACQLSVHPSIGSGRSKIKIYCDITHDQVGAFIVIQCREGTLEYKRQTFHSTCHLSFSLCEHMADRGISI